MVNETIDPAIERIILKIVGFMYSILTYADKVSFRIEEINIKQTLQAWVESLNTSSLKP